MKTNGRYDVNTRQKDRSARRLGQAHRGAFRAPRRCAADQHPIRLLELEPNQPLGEDMIELDLLTAKRIVLQADSVQCRLADLVPAARELSDMIVAQAQAHARNLGACVPCRKGCAACCSYLVPLSAPEAASLAENIAKLPLNQQADIEMRFLDASRRLLASPPPALDQHDQRQNLQRISQWYLDAGVTCPLLSEGLCTIYAARPLACREHFVTSSPSECSPGDGSTKPLLGVLPLSVAGALMDVSMSLEGASDASTMLPLALNQVRQNPHRASRLYPARLLAQQFAAALYTARGHADIHS